MDDAGGSCRKGLGGIHNVTELLQEILAPQRRGRDGRRRNGRRRQKGLDRSDRQVLDRTRWRPQPRRGTALPAMMELDRSDR